MGPFRKMVLSLVKAKLNHSLKIDETTTVSSEGLREFRNIPYVNRQGKELLMDIFAPQEKPGIELPVIINIHGGGLIMGNKDVSIGFCRQLAHRGYLVCSLEYRLIPDVRVYEQFDDVCAGMDCVGRKLLDFDVDYTRIYLVAESAGAYLATYVAAMKKSKALQIAIGYEPTRMNIKAMALISGMFYTTRKDATGRFLSGFFYGNDRKSQNMARFTNPEDPEIIHNIPPCYLVTSKADMLERYTLDFAGELGNNGIEHFLRHMGSDPKLIHAFAVLRPDLPESERVIDEVVDWFRKHEVSKNMEAVERKKEMPDSRKLKGIPSVDKPWLKYYSTEAFTAPLPACTIYEYLWESNKDYPDDIAIHYLGRDIDYKSFFNEIDKTAAAFRALQVKEGDIVTVALPSIPEALYCIYALNKIGAVANMIHPLAGKNEIVYYLNEVNSRVAVLFDGTYKILGDGIQQTHVKHAVVVSAACSLPTTIKPLYYMKAGRTKLPEGDMFQTWKAFIRAGKGDSTEKADKDCNALALISHTGGTTGDPKGVMCSDNTINALIYQLVCNFEYVRQLTSLAVLPPFVNYSLIDSMMAMFIIGLKVVLLPKYEPDKLADYIEKYKPYVICSIPAYWEPALRIEKMKTIDLSCLRYAYYGGEEMSTENEKAITNILLSGGAQGELCKGLGSTEMMSAATQSYADCNDPGSAGVPLVRVNCKIVEPGTDQELTYNVQGEICFSGPTLMLGYYNKPDATIEIVKVHSDGMRWLHTGDLGYITENGVIFVTGRIKRIIMTKGKDGQVTKLFPDRIEKILYTHPAVEVCCVVGVSDEQRIHIPKAFIVLKKGASPSDRLSEDIMAICEANLPEYMVPATIVYREELPRTERGKVDYRALENEESKNQE